MRLLCVSSTRNSLLVYPSTRLLPSTLQGRGKRFKSKKERNTHLAKLAAEAEEERKSKEAAAAQADKVRPPFFPVCDKGGHSLARWCNSI